MNLIEDRIKGAAEAVARAVPDGSTPPLRLAANRNRHPHRPPSPGGGLRRWLTPLAAATAVVAVVAISASLLSAGSARTGSDRHGHRGRPSVAVTSNAAQRAQLAKLDQGAIDFFLSATGAQYTTGALFYGQVQSLERDSAATCMARLGLHVGRITAAQAARGDFDLSQFPDLGQIARAGTLPSGISAVVQPLGSKAFTVKFDRCLRAAEAPFAPLMRGGSRLATPFLKVELSASVPAAVRATLPALRSCAARYGWPSQPYGAPDSTIKSFADFVNWIAGHIDGAVSRGASPAQARALDRRWARAFVTCSRPTVAVQYRIWTAEQQAFLRNHHAQIKAFLALLNKIMTVEERLAASARSR